MVTNVCIPPLPIFTLGDIDFSFRDKLEWKENNKSSRNERNTERNEETG